jgi:hypothetical protein
MKQKKNTTIKVNVSLQFVCFSPLRVTLNSTFEEYLLIPCMHVHTYMYYCLDVCYVCLNFYFGLYLLKYERFPTSNKKKMWLIGKASAIGSMERRFDPRRKHFEIIYNEVIRYHRSLTV